MGRGQQNGGCTRAVQFDPEGHQSIAEPFTRRFGAAAQAALGRLHAIEGRLIAALVGMLLATALVRAVLRRRSCGRCCAGG
jgi:hypothetical protein